MRVVTGTMAGSDRYDDAGSDRYDGAGSDRYDGAGSDRYDGDPIYIYYIPSYLGDPIYITYPGVVTARPMNLRGTWMGISGLTLILGFTKKC